MASDPISISAAAYLVVSDSLVSTIHCINLSLHAAQANCQGIDFLQVHAHPVHASNYNTSTSVWFKLASGHAHAHQ